MFRNILLMIFCILILSYADTWVTKAPMNVARHGIGSGVINNKLYAIGGSIFGIPLSDNEVYDPVNNSWQIVRSMLVPSSGLPAGTVLDGKIYILGGWYYEAILSLNMEFNPSTQSWKVRASMPTPRYDLCCAVVNGKIYAIGGRGYEGDCSTVEEFNPITNSWEYKTNMPTPRSGAGCAVFNNKIYVIGGVQNSRYLNVNEVYDPLTNTWTTLTPMPTPRAFPACVELGGLIYVISGATSAGETNVNEVYDPIKDTWYIKKPIPTPRKGAAYGVINGKIYVAGGSNHISGYLTTTEEYTPDVSIEEQINVNQIENIFISMTKKNIIIKFLKPKKLPITISLYYINGQLVEKWKYHNADNIIKLFPTRTKTFSSGIYFMTIESEGRLIRKKFVCVNNH